MIGELIRAFLLIFAAEMGDKTQIIAMTFATQYKVRDVMAGVFIGVLFNHGIAIVLGRYLSKVIPLNLIQIIAGIMFVIFGILALKDEDEEEIENKKAFGPIATVAFAFFVGELGDKTQLTAMTLATEGNFPLFILMGTILGMIVTSGLGIFIGSKIGEKIPDIFIKITSSIVFIFFGTLKLFSTIPSIYLKPLNIILYFIILIAIESHLIKTIVKQRRAGAKSLMKEVAATLYTQTQMLKEVLDNICLGKDKCGACSGSECLLGYTRHILQEAREKGNYYDDFSVDLNKLIKKDYDKIKVLQALSLILSDYLQNGWEQDQNFVVNQVKRSLEIILFGEPIENKENIDDYFSEVRIKDKVMASILEEKVKENLV
jgi:putative Ca2+/H+ antiporter (TMEM165/GDT1 family)